MREAVRLGPKPDLPGCPNGRIMSLGDLPIVKGDLESVADDFQEQGVPDSARDVDIQTHDLPADSIGHLV